MPSDAVTTRVELDTDGAHDILMHETYEAPCDRYGRPEFDVYKDFDQWRARRVMAVLKTEYPGHFWAVQSDVKQGIVKIGIPILMGVCNWYVINEKQTPVTPGAVIVGGGEILEHYGLSRERFNLGAFLEARAQHSKLVMPSRAIPG